MNGNGARITAKTWERFKMAIRSFLASEAGGRAKMFTAMLLAFMLSINGLNVVNSYVGRDFISAIEHRDAGEFWRQALLYLAVFGLSTVAAVFFRFAEERLGLLWREWQTRQLLERYLEKRVYYQLAVAGDFENPDQRIAEDIRAFTTTTLSFVLMMLNATFTVVAFSGVLWSISPMLFLVAVGYALAGSFVTVLVGRRLVGLNYSLSDREANFRTELIQVREHAASVVMSHREERTKARLLRRLEELVGNARHVIAVNRNVGFFTTGYNYLIQIMPALVVAPLFMRGHVEFGVVTQSAMAFAQLMGAFSLIVTQFQSISSYAAVIARLGVLVDAMDKAASPAPSPVEICERSGFVAYDNLTLRSQNGAVLLENLNIAIPRGTNVLVQGPAGHARLALFEATAGLWAHGAGHIVRPGPEGVMFLPERPHLPGGTLRDLLVPSAASDRITDAQIEAVLQALSLTTAVRNAGGLDVERNWTDVLPPVEQVLVSLAHVVLAAPEFVFLDRVTSVLDAGQLAAVFSLLAKHSITCVCIGKGEARLSSFDAMLHLFSAGNWKWKSLRGSSVTAETLRLPSPPPGDTAIIRLHLAPKEPAVPGTAANG